MITVSEKFRKLAQDNGREVWCRITVGSEEFLDDRITDMTFDDVIHPDCILPLDIPGSFPRAQRSGLTSASTARSGVRLACST